LKIRKLFINGYKNLNDFYIETVNIEDIVALIGINGSGKSNVLEAIALSLINAVSKKDEVNHTYEIDFIDGDNHIYISNKDGRIIKKNDKKVAEKDKRFILPSTTFFYYAGEANRLQSIIENSLLLKQRKKLISGHDIQLRKISLIEELNLSASFIASYVFKLKSWDTLQTLLNVKVVNPSIIINLAKPKWGKNTGAKSLWSSVGVVKEKLENLADNHSSEGIIELDKDTGYIEINDIETLIDYEKTEIELYRTFKILMDEGIISTISIEVDKGTGFFDINSLSEGEKQILNLMLLLEVTKEYKVMFFLDEFDAYLHPNWQRNFTELIRTIDIRGQVIFTTHSATSLTKLDKEQIFILQEGEVFAPNVDTYNRDVSEVMEEIMNIDKRTSDVQMQIDSFNNAINAKQLAAAIKIRIDLKNLLRESDPFFVYADIKIARLERRQ